MNLFRKTDPDTTVFSSCAEILADLKEPDNLSRPQIQQTNQLGFEACAIGLQSP